MTPRDFVYWVQGYFEISSPTTIEYREVQLIKQHLDLVFACDPSPDEIGYETMIWMKGFFAANVSGNLDLLQTLSLKNKINEVFKHEIDPLDGDEEKQDFLNQVHSGSTISNPQTYEEAVAEFGPPPEGVTVWNFHGWGTKEGGLLRC